MLAALAETAAFAYSQAARYTKDVAGRPFDGFLEGVGVSVFKGRLRGLSDAHAAATVVLACAQAGRQLAARDGRDGAPRELLDYFKRVPHVHEDVRANPVTIGQARPLRIAEPRGSAQTPVPTAAEASRPPAGFRGRTHRRVVAESKKPSTRGYGTDDIRRKRGGNQLGG